MATQLDDRQIVNRAALSALGNTANLTLDVIMGDINALFAAATYIPTASVLMTRDANANTQANNFLEGFATTATAAGTTTLTVASKAFQQFTGTSTQTVVLPNATTLTLGQSFTIVNRSTGNVTVQNATPSTLQTMTANSQAIFTVTSIATSAGTWDIAYTVTGAPQFLQTQVTTDSTTTGSAATLLTGDISYGTVRLTNASLVSVSGIPAGASGQQIIIENQTGTTVTINNNDSGATSGNRIYTGTGGAVTMAANASFEFVYDTTSAFWMLVGGTGSGSGSGGSKNYLTVYTASTASGVPNTGNGNFELGSTSGWSLAHTLLSGGVIPLTVGSASVPYVSGLRIWTVTSANATVGAVYTNNGHNYTVQGTIAAGTLLVTTDGGTPSGTVLSKSSGTGDSSITYSSSQSTTGNTSTTTLSAVTSGSQIGGSYSASYACTTTSTSGDMLISNAFFIDAEDQAKVMTFKFYYKVVSGSSNINVAGNSTNVFSVWFYDVTNNSWIQPAGTYAMNQNSGVGYATGTFQTSSNGTQYQIALVNTTGSSGAFTIYFDDFTVGPQTAPTGPAMTDWISYTPTWTAATTNPAIGNGSITAGYMRRGKNLLVKIDILSGTTTTYGSGNYYFSLPSGLSIDTSVVDGATQFTALGIATSRATASLTNYNGAVIASGINSTSVAVAAAGSNNSLWSSTLPAAWAASTANQTISLQFEVPIVGWSSNTSVSSDTDTRVVAFSALSTSTQSISASTTTQVTGWSSVYDTHGGFSSNVYTIPVTGYYRLSAMTDWATASSGRGYIQFYINGSGSYIGQNAAFTSSYQVTTQAVQESYLTAGTTVAVYVNSLVATTLAGTTLAHTWSVSRMSGPSVIAASESVAFAACNTSGQSIPNGTATTITGWTTQFDTHNAFGQVVSGEYLVPVSGKYLATLNVSFGTSILTANAGLIGATISQTGSVSYGASANTTIGSTSGQITIDNTVTHIFNCKAGDYLIPQVYQSNGAARALWSTDNSRVRFSVTRIGN